ncbi:hypothetical protein IPZ58_34655 [Streptomyces roseoverticillatus]|uniref:HEAT repeat domain-containing protein n=1 Tax=Streptomyces roseoverticillatus TaxID=66429 RepID=UPI002286AC64|nr:HEAT repeat domain-containing protein [Streptomyces roseoverticillatus]MCF3106671.1 hypothetical protein [Streptomyces roseoverticillatus]
MSGGREDAAFAQLLADAGLEAREPGETGESGDAGHTANTLRPPAAWRPVIAFDATPAVAVRLDRPDLVAEINAQWYRLATEHSVIGADGTFLINIAGGRTPASRGWTRVRLAAQWDLAGVLGDRPGQPEFVTLSADGDTLLGVTTEEYEVWLVAVDGFGRQREAEAQAAARETPQEREAAWASFFRGPGPTKALGEKWAAGLAHNPAAPEDVLQGLLGHSHYLPWRSDLPSSVVDAGLAHPEWRVRSPFVDALRPVTPEQWTRLVLAEQDPRQRWILATCAADRREELTGPAYEQLAADPAARTRAEAARLTGLPVHLLTALATDPEPEVRASACRPAWPHLDDPARQKLLADADPEVRTAARLTAFPRHGLLRHAGDPDPRMRRLALDDPASTAELVERFSRDADDEVRLRAAQDPRLTAASAVRLLDDAQALIRRAAALHPRLPARVLARLLRDEAAETAAANPSLPIGIMREMLRLLAS